MSKYFPESQGIPPEQLLDRPRWAKGARLTQEALEALPPKPPPIKTPYQAPGPRPRDLKWVKALAAAHTDEAIKTLASLMMDKDGDSKVRMAASVALLERAWGKPAKESVPAGSLARPQTDPEALHARIYAVVGTMVAAESPRQLREVINADSTEES